MFLAGLLTGIAICLAVFQWRTGFFTDLWLDLKSRIQ